MLAHTADALDTLAGGSHHLARSDRIGVSATCGEVIFGARTRRALADTHKHRENARETKMQPEIDKLAPSGGSPSAGATARHGSRVVHVKQGGAKRESQRNLARWPSSLCLCCLCYACAAELVCVLLSAVHSAASESGRQQPTNSPASYQQCVHFLSVVCSSLGVLLCVHCRPWRRVPDRVRRHHHVYCWSAVTASYAASDSRPLSLGDSQARLSPHSRPSPSPSPTADARCNRQHRCA